MQSTTRQYSKKVKIPFIYAPFLYLFGSDAPISAYLRQAHAAIFVVLH